MKYLLLLILFGLCFFQRSAGQDRSGTSTVDTVIHIQLWLLLPKDTVDIYVNGDLHLARWLRVSEHPSNAIPNEATIGVYRQGDFDIVESACDSTGRWHVPKKVLENLDIDDDFTLSYDTRNMKTSVVLSIEDGKYIRFGDADGSWRIRQSKHIIEN